MTASVPFTVTTDFDLGNRVTPYIVESAADVELREGAVPESLTGAHVVEPAYEVADGRFLLKIPNGLRLLVEEGKRITYHRGGNSDAELALFLTGSAWGALCYQRGLLPLHASGVLTAEGVCAFTGPSGAGKSTIAAALSRRGFGFFTDDIVILDATAKSAPIPAYAGQRDLKLWDDALELTASPQLGRVRDSVDIPKFYSTPLKMSAPTVGPMSKLVILARTKESAEQEKLHDIQPMDGPKALLVLRNNIYRSRFAEAIWGRQRFFATLAGLVGKFDLFTFRRLFLPDHFDDSADLLADWLGRPE